MLRALLRGLRRLANPAAADRELGDEVAHYLEMSARERMRAGLSRAEAERAARVNFGGVEAAKELVRAGGWEAKVEGLWNDARYALRGMRHNPGFAAVAAITLGLGIGATTAIFSVINTVMLRPLPYRDPHELALVWTDDTRRGLHTEPTAFSTIADWRAASGTLEGLAFHATQRATLAGGGGRERTRSALVSGDFFSLLGVIAARGRVIDRNDEAAAAGVAVISHQLWTRRFGGDSGVLGRTVTIEDAGKGGPGTFEIVGVMPADFYFPDKLTEVWLPATTYWRFARESSERFPPWARRWVGLARVKPGVSLDDARIELGDIGRRLAAQYPSDVPDFPGFAPNVVPLLESVAGRNLQATLWLLFGAVSLVLLVACANVANLLLARGAGRQHEFALRRALGAQRGRLARQLLVESAVLAGLGGALGLLLASFGTRLLAAAAAAQLPRMDEMRLDANVLVFAVAASLAAALAFGVVPALRASSTSEMAILKEGGRSTSGRNLLRTRGLLVVAECAVAVVLLAAAGLLLRSLDRLLAIDPGFDPSQVLSIRLEFPPEPPSPAERVQSSEAAQATARTREQRVVDLAARLQALPGVRAVGFVDDMYIAGQGHASITIPGRSAEPLAGEGQLNDGTVSAGFFEAMRVPLRRGRLLTREDGFTKVRALWAPPVSGQSLADKERTAIAEPVVVNEAFVRRFFPIEDPVGRRFCIDPTNKTYWYVIVGVVGDMRRQGLDQRAIPEYYGPWIPSPGARADLLVRTDGDPLALAPTVRQLLLAALPGTLIANVSTAARDLDAFSATRWLQTWLLAVFAAVALVLSAIGIYGIVHYTVTRRAREIGVRIALGASAPEVVRMVVTTGMRTPLIGMAIGLVASLGLTRVMTRWLFGISPTDPLTYAGVALVLGIVALCACLMPARRAARLDPLVVLRQE